MATINLYKISSSETGGFYAKLAQKMDKIPYPKDKNATIPNGWSFELYFSNGQKDRSIKWNWLLTQFDRKPITVATPPKAVLIIKHPKSMYVVTFGSSFFLVDKYCDRDFAFNYARKVQFNGIKTNTLTAPNSHRNKTVNTYIDYNELDFGSGEAFAKLKAKLDPSEAGTLFKPTLEIGTSIKFIIKEENLTTIIRLIQYVERVCASEIIKQKIPVFSEVRDKEQLQRLEKRLSEAWVGSTISIPELEVIGTTEIFNSADYDCTLEWHKKRKPVTSLSYSDVMSFYNELNSKPSSTLDVKVTLEIQNEPSASVPVKEIIEWTDDEEQCFLSKGKWYKYNNDYIDYLSDSISEIETHYDSKYDFTLERYKEFINTLGKKEESKYTYAEDAFNNIMSLNYGFENRDREIKRIKGHPYEPMDLYKDNTIYTVKIGKTAAKLCYSVDQSLATLKGYKSNRSDFYKEKNGEDNTLQIDTFAIWLVLVRSSKLPLKSDGTPDINGLKMLTLKNRLDQWKKEVRLQGFKPIIYINYRDF
ncbi:DUF6119 family protein [Scardovia wiggsiae]|uniref:DUF6119 family protein n=1 Tax=Scardovia wiggsiae TaxID=230143 RepID=UPI00374EA34A